MKRCACCEKEYDDKFTKCSHCGISLGKPIQENEIETMDAPELGIGHIFAILSLCALLFWCVYCGYWWNQTQGYYWNDAPDLLPVIGSPDVQLYLSISVWACAIYTLIALIRLIGKKRYAVPMALMPYAFMGVINVFVAYLDWKIKQGLGHAVHNYNVKVYFLIVVAFFVLGFVWAAYYRDKDDCFGE